MNPKWLINQNRLKGKGKYINAGVPNDTVANY